MYSVLRFRVTTPINAKAMGAERNSSCRLFTLKRSMRNPTLSFYFRSNKDFNVGFLFCECEWTSGVSWKVRKSCKEKYSTISTVSWKEKQMRYHPEATSPTRSVVSVVSCKKRKSHDVAHVFICNSLLHQCLSYFIPDIFKIWSGSKNSHFQQKQ